MSDTPIKILLGILPNTDDLVFEELKNNNLISEKSDLKTLSALNLSFTLSTEKFDQFLLKNNNAAETREIKNLFCIENFYQILNQGNSVKDTIDNFVEIQEGIYGEDDTVNFKVICKNIPDNFRGQIIRDIRDKLPNWRPAPFKRKHYSTQSDGDNKLKSENNVQVIILRVEDQFYILKDFLVNPYHLDKIKSASHRQKIRPVLAHLIAKKAADDKSDLLKIFGATSLQFNLLAQSSSLPSKTTFLLNLSPDNHPNSLVERELIREYFNKKHPYCDFIITNNSKCLRTRKSANERTLNVVEFEKFDYNPVEEGSVKTLNLGSTNPENSEKILTTFINKTKRIVSQKNL